MMGKVAVVLLVVVLLMSTVSCSGTFDLRVEKTPTPAVGPAADAVATLDAAVRATLAAPKATPTTSPDVQATVQAAVAATVAAQQGAAMPEPTAALPAPGGPSTLLFSTYLGGRDSDRIHDLAVDGEGNVYIVGTTSSPDLPTTPGAYDASHNGAKDAFVAKLSADGSTLLYSTYLGGGGDDSGNAIAVDGEGNAYVTGWTRSVDLPTTPGAADTRRDGGQDAFVAQLSADGGELIYGTYLGGDSDEAGLCIAVDGTRSAYVGGGTYSFPVTPGAAQTTHGGLIDGFVAKLSPDGDSLIYATYVGSSSYEQIAGIAVDREGNAYLATGASASDFPTTPGAYDRVCENCMTNVSGDAAVVKLSADGTRFIYSTLVGGADPKGQEAFHDVAVDSAGNAYLTGYSSSVDFPTTPGALQQTFGGGDFDVIVTRLNADGSDLLYSTYLGGAGHEQGLGIAVDAAGSATVGGFTDSVDFPTAFPLQPANGGQKDFFLVKLDQDASTLLFGTYFGGGGDDFEDMSESFRMGFDQTGRGVYLTGATGSTDLPTTAGAYDVSFNGGAHDGFVALLNPFASEESAAPAAAPAPLATLSALGVWHVAVDGSDTTGDGSEARPFATIQHGIDVARDGNTVLVHPGTYKENINFRGKNITVGSLFVITGDEELIQQTVIDGDRQDHVVTFAGGEDTSAELSGFTITNGYAQGASAPETHGGGVFCWSLGGVISGPTLTHLKVTGNEAVEEGGGLYFALCSPVIQDVSVTDNDAHGSGGGMRFSYGSPTLRNVIVIGNSAVFDGGGIHFYHADATVTNALVADNSGSGKGSGMGFDGSSPTFVNVTVVGNRTTGHGGGLNVSFASRPTLVNSIVWGNSPEQIYFDTDWGDEAVTIEFSDIQGGEGGIVTNGLGPVYWGDGNMDADPRFVDAGAGDYRLADDSPCLAAGRADGAPATDLEGNPRPNPEGSRPDLGAYESPSKGAVRLMGPVAWVL